MAAAQNPSVDEEEGVLLHILVIGFHHKKGCQVEYSFPPLVKGSAEDSGEIPLEWKYLPTLALPDGAHNFSKDTIYFHLRNRKSAKHTVYGVACYRQIDAKDLVNKTDDITRATVQKSVCVLTTLPMYGAVAAKLELITHAWFEQKDFTKVSLLRDAFYSLKSSVSPESMETQAFLGLNIHDVVKLYKHKIVLLFKLILLERKVVFFMSPVKDLCNVILCVLSLFPGLLENGMVESVQNMKIPAISPTMQERTLTDGDTPFVEIRYTGEENSQSNENSADTAIVEQPSSAWVDCPPPIIPSIDRGENVPVEQSVSIAQNLPTNHGDQSSTVVTVIQESEKETDTTHDREKEKINRSNSLSSHKEDIPEVHQSPKSPASETLSEPDPNLVIVDEAEFLDGPITHAQTIQSNQVSDLTELDSADAMREIDMEDQACFSWDDKVTLAIRDEENVKDQSQKKEERTEDKGDRSNLNLTFDTKATREVRVVPVLSPTSISIDRTGFPLAIFTKGSVCHPYLSLSYYDILEDVNIRSFIIGASNVLFKQKKHNVDVIVEGDPQLIHIHDKELAKQLQLTTEDLRFADMISKQVEETVASGEFLESTEWEGGDEWIRAQFRNYLQSLMATVLADDTKLLDGFNPSFVNAWKTTHNYKIWRNTVQQLQDVIPGHVCQGGVSFNDMKLHLNRTERGKKINAAMDNAGKAVTDTGKVVGSAFGSARSFVSNWWANVTSPTSPTPKTLKE